METKNSDNRLSGLKMVIKATLISTPLLITACGGSSEEVTSTNPNPSTTPLTEEPLAVTRLSEKSLSEIKADVRAATVQITTVGDAILPRGLTSVDIQQRGRGTGFFIDETGYIVTNNHVVTGAGQLSVKVDGVNLLYPAELVGVAECADLAVIRTTMGNNGFEALKWPETGPEINLVYGSKAYRPVISSLLLRVLNCNLTHLMTPPQSELKIL